MPTPIELAEMMGGQFKGVKGPIADFVSAFRKGAGDVPETTGGMGEIVGETGQKLPRQTEEAVVRAELRRKVEPQLNKLRAATTPRSKGVAVRGVYRALGMELSKYATVEAEAAALLGETTDAAIDRLTELKGTGRVPVTLGGAEATSKRLGLPKIEAGVARAKGIKTSRAAVAEVQKAGKLFLATKDYQPFRATMETFYKAHVGDAAAKPLIDAMHQNAGEYRKMAALVAKQPVLKRPEMWRRLLALTIGEGAAGGLSPKDVLTPEGKSLLLRDLKDKKRFSGQYYKGLRDTAKQLVKKRSIVSLQGIGGLLNKFPRIGPIGIAMAAYMVLDPLATGVRTGLGKRGEVRRARAAMETEAMVTTPERYMQQLKNEEAMLLRSARLAQNNPELASSLMSLSQQPQQQQEQLPSGSVRLGRMPGGEQGGGQDMQALAQLLRGS